MENKNRKNHYFLIIVTLLVLAALFVNLCIRTYFVSKDNIINSHSMDISQQTKDVDYILLKYVSELGLSADMVEKLIEDGRSNEEILDFFLHETEITTSVFESVDTGLYGVIRGEYLDGVGWIPDESYDPKTRPWYRAAIEAKGETVLVDPYIDAQTHDVVMSMVKSLKDGESVVAFDVKLGQMQREARRIADDTDTVTFILTDNETVAASSWEYEVGYHLSEATGFVNTMYKAYLKSGGENFEFSYKDTDYIVFNKLMYGDWRALAINETEGMFVELNKLYITAVAVFLLASFDIFIAIYIMYRARKKTEDINRQLQSIADIYTLVYKLDLGRSSYQEIQNDSGIIPAGTELPPKPKEMVAAVMQRLMKDTETGETEDLSDIERQLELMADADVLTYELEAASGWIRVRYVALERRDGQIRSLLWVLENIDKEKKREEQLVREVHCDELTGLLNRKAFQELLDGYELLPPKEQERLAYVVMDIDNLKIVNDSMGHSIGDLILINAAECMKQSFGRYGDIYRVGGDEFIAIVCEDEVPLTKMINCFVGMTESWSEANGKTLSVSYGYAERSEYPQASASELIKIADMRMYENKRDSYEGLGLSPRDKHE